MRRMSVGGTQQSLRKALGALKDSTTVGLAKVNSDFKVSSSLSLSLPFSLFLSLCGSSSERICSFNLFWFLVILKDLDVAIVKATNHVERPAKEKHIQGQELLLSSF